MSIKILFTKIKDKIKKMTPLMKGSIALATLLAVTAIVLYLVSAYFDLWHLPGSMRSDQTESIHTTSQTSTTQNASADIDKTAEETSIDQTQPTETTAKPTPAATTQPSATEETFPDETADTTASVEETSLTEDVTTSTEQRSTESTTSAAETTAALTQDEIDRLIREDNTLISSDSQADAMLALQSDVLDYLGMRSLNMGVFYFDLETGAYFSINPYRQFRSASTAKVFAIMAMYEAVNDGSLSLDQEVTYSDDDYERGSGILRHQEEIGTYTLRELAKYAMQHSDNIAYHMIMRTVGRSQAYDYYESIIGHETNRTVTQMSAADAKALLHHLYTSDNQYFSLMIDDLRQNDFRQALPRYLPEGSVSNKIGFLKSQGLFHDIAIVHGERPYILAVFSHGIVDDFSENPETLLAELSKLIYEKR